MAEYIGCRNCNSPNCKGCNIKTLETMLNNGKFDCLMDENRRINTSADVAPVRHGRMTYMPSLIQSIVLQHKDELSDKDRACILQDKDFQRRCDLWGSDFDRADWERFYERLGER